MPARVLPHDQLAFHYSHRFRAHYLIRQLFLNHPVLMDACLMGKSILPYDGLVRLDFHPGQIGQHAAGRKQFPGIHPGVDTEKVFACAQRHYNLLEGSIARALAYSVDGAFNLTGAVLDRTERICHRKSKIVVAVHGQNGLMDIRNVLAQITHRLAVFGGEGIPYRVGNIDDVGAFLDNRLHNFAKVLKIGTGRVLG